MNEKATLVYAGMASSLVLGITNLGSDPDGSDFPMEFEFDEDRESTAGFSALTREGD